MLAIVTHQQADTACKVLSKAFINLSSMTYIARKSNSVQAIKALCSYCLKVSMSQSSAYISEDEHAVLLLLNNEKPPSGLKLLLWKIQLINRSIGWFNVPQVLGYMNLKRKMRSKEKAIYIWMIASEKSDHEFSSALDLKDSVFEMANDLQLPLLMEATISKNTLIYRRYGFEIYHKEEKCSTRDFPIWFMRRAPKSTSHADISSVQERKQAV